MKIFLMYLLLINVAGFSAMYIDKRRAVAHRWRIPEKSLFLLSVIGGSIGTLLGMYLCHHKTKHWYFVIGMPAILIIHLILLYIILFVWH